MTLSPILESDWIHMDRALDCARRSLSEGGIPVGSILVRDGVVLGQGSNQSRQTNDPTSHAEIDCLRNAGVLQTHADTTMYTTLGPCSMCAGAAAFLHIGRVVIGDNQTYPGQIDFLLSQGIAVTVLNHQGCIDVLSEYVKRNKDFWTKLTS
jgi:cytosine deaminase